jgi:pimeloyl-ACP methyl ester carboxylesterase
MAQATATPTVAVGTARGIRPFTIDVPEADLQDLRVRIATTRWPERETVPDQSQGTQLATMQALARYWLTEYDWGRCETQLNAVPNFITEIDGLDIHFLHVRSVHEDALPLIICHGWPGSIVEQLKIIGPLTDPTAHVASASDAFHVVVPSMPGYGYSGKPTSTGWDVVRIANAYVELMKLLGYTRFVAQGGDWGSIVVEVMAGGRDAPAPPKEPPDELLGIHVNLAGVFPPEIDKALIIGNPPPPGLSSEEQRACDQLASFYKHVGYGIIMGDRPQTLTALADSPIGLAAFMLDHDAASLELISRAFAGDEGGLTRDDVLDNVTHFWLTNTAVSASRLYWENKASYFAAKNVTAPVGVSVFPDELYQAPASWAQQAYPNLLHYSEHDIGGHYAAWEQPQLLSKDVRATFRSLR